MSALTRAEHPIYGFAFYALLFSSVWFSSPSASWPCDYPSSCFSYAARVQPNEKPSQREALNPSKSPIRLNDLRRLVIVWLVVDHFHYSAASLHGPSKPISKVFIPRKVDANA